MDIDKFYKILEKFSKTALKKNKGVAFQTPMSVGSTLNLFKNFKKTQRDYKTKLNQNLNKLINKKLSKDEYLKIQKENIKEAFSNAYLNGKQMVFGKTAALDESERRFIGKAVSDEFVYMKNFADDVINQRGKMSYIKRMEMYSNSLSAMFVFGRLLYMPENVRIIWKLGVTDKHCIDCLSFAANNPYSKRTLPTVPKAGKSRCLANCKCSIEYVLTDRLTDYESFLMKLEEKQGRTEIPTESEYIYLASLRRSFYSALYAAELNGTNKDTAFKIKQQIDNFLNTHKLMFDDSLNYTETLKQFKEFKTHTNFKIITDITDLISNDLISVFIDNQQFYAKVVKNYGTEVQVKTIEGILLLLNPKREVLFRYVD